jgi:hypothetical protein
VHALCVLYNEGYRHTQNVYYASLSHDNSGYANAPRCYVKRTLYEYILLQLTSFGAEFFVFQFAIQKIKIYKTTIFPVLYGCETWSLTLREKRRLRVFENRVLRRVFGPKRDEVTVEWRK